MTVTAKPTPRQLEYQDWEFGIFLHFGIRTFYEGHRDWDGKPMSPSAFNPTQFDCNQWVTTAQEAGAKYMVLVVKHLEFVQSARALGARAARIMGRHVLPNIVGPIVILATLRMATAILTAAALSFIGLGVQPPAPEWGAMLAEGKAYLRVAPHVVVFPGITIMVVVLAFNLMGDGLRDALDPSTTIEGRTDS
ncbi:MAG: ABC transporter permease subunit [Candidatus Rokubacteria bacterium]|nr:ABC transporter permease subunit [Candidatus Rokubacteria bacterium]